MFRFVTTFLLVAALAAVAMTGSAAALSRGATDVLLAQRWAEWKAQYGKTYRDEREDRERFAHFVASVERVAARRAHVAALPKEDRGSVEFGLTKFADMSEEEFAETHRNFRTDMTKFGRNDDDDESRGVATMQPPAGFTAPDAYDWRDANVVTGVKDQGGCGSCWSFSAVEAVETAWALAGNELTVFSEQQLVSCDDRSYGCRGGDPTSADVYITKVGGLASEEDYPYTSGTFPWTNGRCQDYEISGGTIQGYNFATDVCYLDTCFPDEDLLRDNTAAYSAPSICVDATGWQDYVGGVMTAAASGCKNGWDDLDHCVQLTGYGVDGGVDGDTPYWTVRNSWAYDWGVGGYIYLARDGKNTCGVATEASIPLVAE